MPLKLTLVALVNPVPVITTADPIIPELGLKEVKVGVPVAGENF